MDERKLFILGAILQSYINEGQPIGSRTLRRDYEMNISAATIRNEMSDLEHMGYLEKAHTSSGRIPVEKAYRWYVDELLRRGDEPEPISAISSRSLLKQSYDPENLLDQALTILSDLTDSVAFAILPARTEDVIEKIRFLPLSSHELLTVTVFNTRFVDTELIHLDADYSKERLERLGEIFQELFEGHRLCDVSAFLQSEYFSGKVVHGNLMSELVPALIERLNATHGERVVFQGMAKWLHFVEGSDLPDALQFLEELRDNPDFLGLLDQISPEKGMMVRIGSENELPLLNRASLIATPFRVHGDVYGALGVIGPLRLHYRNVIGHVRRIGKYLDSITGRE